MNLLQKIVSAAENKAVEKAWQAGRMCCPNCGGSPSHPPTGADSMVHCGGCGYQALPMDWIPQRNGVLTGHADRVPPNTRIRREGGTHGNCVWHIPASGRFGFFLFFGSFWLAITALVSGGFVMAALQGKSDAPWFIYPFFAVFWAVGIGCIYAAVRNKFARHQLIVTDGTVTLRRELLGRTKAKSLPVAEVTKVEQTVFYQQNYQPVYGVEIRGRRGKLRFGTTLSEAEKAWLVADIRRAVFGEPVPQAPVAVSAPEAVIAVKAGLRQSSFSFPLPPPSKAGWMIGVILVLIGTGALVMAFEGGADWSGDDKNAPWFVQVFEAIFMLGRLIPLFVGLIFGGIGVLLIYHILSGRGRDVRLEGDELQVALRTYRHGRVMKEQAYPRESVREARATRCGAINERVMKRIDLIVDDKAKRVTHWTEGGVADAWVASVNEALGI